MKNFAIFMIAFILMASSTRAQVGINTDQSEPDPSAMLDVKSTSKGVLLPRMTFQELNAISNPADGLMVLCTNCTDPLGSAYGNPVIYIYFSGKWRSLWADCKYPTYVAPATHISQVTEITWYWNPHPIATGYKWNTTGDYSSAIDLGNSTTYTETGLTCFTSYNRFVWAYNECGHHDNPSMLQDTTLPITFSPAPTAVTHTPGYYQVVWNWNPVTGATGYKWNTIDDFGTATNLGTATSTTEYGLICGTSYTRFVWAYDDCGYSAATSLMQTTSACPTNCQPFTDERDGKNYNTVLIGTQCWMAQNLNIGTKINGSQNQTNNQVIEKYCYNDLESNCDIYGGLYQWDEAMQYVTTAGVQGICPAGWHLPTDAEWTILTTFLGGESVAGGKMKEIGTTHWLSPNTGATNSSAFTALPGGYREWSGGFQTITYYAKFWSSSESSSFYAWYRYLDYYYAVAHRWDGYFDKTSGFSGRCVKD